jgi:hypothetical protein
MVENFAVTGRMAVKVGLEAAKTAGDLRRVRAGTRRVLVAVRMLRLIADMVIFSNTKRWMRLPGEKEERCHLLGRG